HAAAVVVDNAAACSAGDNAVPMPVPMAVPTPRQAGLRPPPRPRWMSHAAARRAGRTGRE
ncbi:hypothetical protein F1542_03295, partial [Komagataeibacter sp. FXV3]|nr:hypothetical protein [Komagataeibacter sp. FXV3]